MQLQLCNKRSIIVVCIFNLIHLQCPILNACWRCVSSFSTILSYSCFKYILCHNDCMDTKYTVEVPPFCHFEQGKAPRYWSSTADRGIPTYTAYIIKATSYACVTNQNVCHQEGLFRGRTDSVSLSKTNSNRIKGKYTALRGLFDWQLIKIQKQNSNELLPWKMQIRKV